MKLNLSLIVALFFCLGLSVSCSKKPILEVNPDFVGSWRIKTPNYIRYLSIENDSRGYIATYDGSHQFQNDTQERKWVTKNDYLYFGYLGSNDQLGDGEYDEKFKIDATPTVSNSQIITGVDTVYVGETYIVLDGNYYILVE